MLPLWNNKSRDFGSQNHATHQVLIICHYSDEYRVMCLINHRATTEIHSTRSLWLLPWNQEQVCFLSATTIPFCCIIWRQHPSNQRYEWQHLYNNINISIEWYALSYSLSTKTSTKKHADYPFSYWIQKRPREISVIYAIHTWYTDFNQGDWRSSSIQHAYIVLWSTNYTGEGAFSKTQQKHPAWLWSHQYQRTTHLHKTTHLSCCGETLRKLSWSSICKRVNMCTKTSLTDQNHAKLTWFCERTSWSIGFYRAIIIIVIICHWSLEEKSWCRPTGTQWYPKKSWNCAIISYIDPAVIAQMVQIVTYVKSGCDWSYLRRGYWCSNL